MNCPACGFDNPDGAGWCDFCKEPFRPAKASPSPAAPVRAPSALPVPEKAPRNGVPNVSEFKELDPGERIPTTPPWVRWFAWGFLGLWFLWGAILLGVYLGKSRLAAGERGAPAPTSP